VIGPSSRGESAGDLEARTAVSELVAAGIPRRQAVDLVARLTGASRNRLYRESL
jgi:hypothetical protein